MSEKKMLTEEALEKVSGGNGGYFCEFYGGLVWLGDTDDIKFENRIDRPLIWGVPA